jgi:hypothetical protein
MQGELENYSAAGIWILGVFAGSTIGWYILGLLANSLRNNMAPKYLKRINRIFRSINFVFGLWALLR